MRLNEVVSNHITCTYGKVLKRGACFRMVSFHDARKRWTEAPGQCWACVACPVPQTHSQYDHRLQLWQTPVQQIAFTGGYPTHITEHISSGIKIQMLLYDAHSRLVFPYKLLH